MLYTIQNSYGDIYYPNGTYKTLSQWRREAKKWAVEDNDVKAIEIIEALPKDDLFVYLYQKYKISFDIKPLRIISIKWSLNHPVRNMKYTIEELLKTYSEQELVWAGAKKYIKD